MFMPPSTYGAAGLVKSVISLFLSLTCTGAQEVCAKGAVHASVKLCLQRHCMCLAMESSGRHSPVCSAAFSSVNAAVRTGIGQLNVGRQLAGSVQAPLVIAPPVIAPHYTPLSMEISQPLT
jgi:hypothetical protein